jgi:membrane protease YdiL (CAAX protease family)
MKIFWIYTLIAVAAIVTMDFMGFPEFSALPLTLLLVIGWRSQKFSKQEMGFHWGTRKDYLYAVGYPVVVMSITLLVVWTFEGLTFTEAGIDLVGIVVMSAVGIFGAFITEEGFFRALLWRFSKNNGQTVLRTLLLTTAAFSLWHIPVALFEFGDTFPTVGKVIYMFNVVLLGLNWGLVRAGSGSSIVAAASHAVWNAIAYQLFGFGELISGALITSNDFIYSPETGMLGILLSALAFVYYFQKVRRDGKLD